MASKEYEAAHTKFRALDKASAGGDLEARREKVKVMNDIRQMEKDAARAGTILAAQYRGDGVVVEETSTPTKRSLQEEYVRKFDDKTPVMIDGKETTLRAWHSKRLLGK